MTSEQKLAVTKTLLGISGTAEDTTLATYLLVAESKIISRLYPYSPENKSVPTQYEYLQCEIAVFLYNKRGAEGETAHSEGSVNRTYENADVPESMLKGITSFVGVQ